MKANEPEYYRAVPHEQRALLQQFRGTHPPKHLTVAGQDWSYLACGQGETCLVFLPGGLQISEPFFHLILALEDRYRIIAPSYPPARSIRQWVDGVAAILDVEAEARVDLVGTSLGGMLAQCFVRRYPERVGKLVLGDTTGPDPGYARRLAAVSQVVKALPLGLLRWLADRRFAAYLAAVPATEQAFWQAYFKEYVACRWTRARIRTQYDCILDFARHYHFTPTDLASWPGQILIVESDDDQAIPAPLRQALKALYPQAQVYTFHGAGHIPGITRRYEYSSLLKTFLSPARHQPPLPAAVAARPHGAGALVG